VAKSASKLCQHAAISMEAPHIRVVAFGDGVWVGGGVFVVEARTAAAESANA
jgi:hypothetical protein